MADIIRDQIIKDLRLFREKYSSISRDSYRKLGKYRIQEIYNTFGSWGEALVQAGITEEWRVSVEELKKALKDDYITIYKNLGKPPSYDEFLKHSSFSKHNLKKCFNKFSELRQFCANYVEDIPSKIVRQIDRYEVGKEYKPYVGEVISYVGKYERSNSKNHKVLMVCSDLHDKWIDPFALKVWLDSVKRIQPDYINFAGDVFDFYEVSRFDKDPRRIFSLQSEIDFVVENIFKPTREAAPNAQIDLLIGNHEFRLVKFLMSQGQALSSLRALRFGELFGLDKYQINLSCHDRFAENVSIDKDRNYKVYDDLFLVTHGTSTAPNHAQNELSRWGMSGVSGHVHHNQSAKNISFIDKQYKTDAHGSRFWVSLGCMCDLDSGKEYIDSVVAWQQGFGIFHIFPEDKSIIPQYIDIKNVAIVDGIIYRRNNKLTN